MAVKFRLQTLSLRTFRGVRELDVEMPADAPGVLIGVNNAGKSTILNAISLALAGPSSYNYTPTDYDFFRDASGAASTSFEISIKFVANASLELPAVRGAYGDPVSVYGARVEGSTDKSGRHEHDTRLLDSNGESITLPVSIPLKGAAKEAWKEHKLAFRMRNARWSDIGEHRPEVWLLRPDNLFVSLYQWKTGPLQRLASLLAKKFFESKWTFEYSGKKQRMPDRLHDVHRFFAEAVKEFPFWRENLKPRLEQTLSEYVGRQARFDLSPDIHAIEEWLAKQLALSFAADAGGAVTPLESMGQGWQSLARIAALDVLSQYPEEVQRRIVLLFEEPESFLHPHLSRKLRGVLDRLASGGWTVLISTHSPNFVSFAGGQTIIRLARNGENIERHILKVAELDGAAKFQERLDERGAHEMLFAKRAVLCEGQDDVFAIRSYLERRSNLDLDGSGISVIRTGDVGQLPNFASMAKRLGIPWCAVCDEDRMSDGTIKDATALVHERLTKAKSEADENVQWPVDLEGCLRKQQGSATAEWQAANIEPKSSDDLRREHPGYVAACEAIRAWIEKG